MNIKYQPMSCVCDLYTDSYNKGEIDCVDSWNMKDFCGQKDTIEEVLKEVPYLERNYFDGPIRFENDPCGDGELDRFETSIMVQCDKENGEIRKPTEQEYADWKLGKINLYSLLINVKLAKICPITSAEVHDNYDIMI